MDDTIPLVEGLRLTERADDAGAGEVWRARVTGGLGGAEGSRLPGELAGVGECVVRLLRLPVDEAARARAYALAKDLVTFEDPGAVRVKAVRRAFDGVALILDSPSSALPLHLLARRRLLAAGEVVTLGVALAWALDAAHHAGLTHGRLRDSDILLDPAGRPLLTGIGVMGVLGAAGEPDGDVRALVRLLGSMLDRESTGASRVTKALERSGGSAGELAAELAEAAPAVALQLAETTDADPPQTEAARGSARGLRQRRKGKIAVAGAGILASGAAAGWISVPSGSPPPARPQPAKAAPATDWRGVLARLDVARAAAFARPNAAALTEVDAPGGSAYRYDAAAVASLRSRHAHAVGLHLTLEQVAVRSVSARRVALEVTDRRLGYQLADAQDRVIATVPARGSQRHLIVLEMGGGPGSGGWRVAQVT